jgi:hypothetical protein
MEKINAQKYLLDNKCDDLILNDRPWTKVKDRIYSSDIMMQFAKDYHEAELKKLRVGDVSQQRELLDWLSNEPDHNIRKSDINEILQDFKYYQSNCG